MTKNYTQFLHIFTVLKRNICKIICVKIKAEVGKVAKKHEKWVGKVAKSNEKQVGKVAKSEEYRKEGLGSGL